MSWKDRTYQMMDEGGASYPFVQWINDGGQLDPRSPRGGFAMPEEQMEDLGAYPAGANVRALTFRNGESTTVFFTEQMEVVVLATRFCWLKDGNRVSNYVPGARSKLQALCLMRGDTGFAGPMMLTFRGIPGKHFAEAYKKHRARVRKATKGAAPSYAFVMRIAAGEPTMVGSRQQSRITPVVLADDFDPDASYVGDAVLDSFDNKEFWAEVKAWREAWAIPGPNGDGEVEDEDNGHRTAQQDIAELYGDDAPAKHDHDNGGNGNRPAGDPQSWARAVNTPLPPTQKYGKNATVGDLMRARDVNVLQWFVAHAGNKKYPQITPEIAQACSVVLEELRKREDEIPF